MTNNISSFHKFLIIIFNIFLVLLVIWSIANTLITSKAFYTYEFEKQDVMSGTGYTLNQLNHIASHIIDYLADKEDSMQVQINGKDIFSNQAIFHMQDVKSLIINIQQFLFYIFVIWVIIGIFLYLRRKEFKLHFFKYNFIVFLSVLGLFILIGLVATINFDFTFEAFHRLIFWDEISFRDAFFTDTSYYPEAPGIDNRLLVKILPYGLFVDAAMIIVVGTILILAVISLIFYLRYRHHIKLQKNQM